MANYIIIGGDNKEYGPVSETDIKQWISEGRLNAESRAKAESDAEFRPLAQFPEFAALLAGLAASGSPTVPPLRTSTEFLDRDYELDISGCISRSFELLKENFGIIFGSFIVMLLVFIAASGALSVVRLPFNNFLLQAPAAVRTGFEFFYSLLMSLVSGPLMGGLFLVYLKTIRREPTGLGEVFAGFQRAYVNLFLGALVVSVIAGLCMLPFQYVFQVRTGPLLAQMQHLQNDPAGLQSVLPQFFSAFGSCLPLFLVCMVPMIFFTVSLQFTLPLIADKGMDFATALKTSWHMVMKHWWYMFGLTVVVGLVTLLGLLGCCIGILFTAPIGLAALMFAYETIFGAPKN